MAEVVETHDLTAPSQDGWAVDYRIRREDGEELHAEVRCWKRRRSLPNGQQTLMLSPRSRIGATLLRSSMRSWWSPQRRAGRC
jgi:hypothetical protein